MARIVYESDANIKKFISNGWTFVGSKHTSGGLDAAVFKRTSPTYKGKSDYCFAFRGTRGGKDIVASDAVEVVAGLHVNQVPDSIEWIRSIIKKYTNDIGKVYFTGHSLGGYLAAWAQTEVVDGGITVPNSSFTRTFNAPGITLVALKPSFAVIIQAKNAFELLGRYDNYISNYAISRNVLNSRFGTYSLQTVDPVFAWGNSLGKVVKCIVLNDKYYNNPFNYHFIVRFEEILNTSNFPD
ncbi:prolyl oligopeptidase family serine peptidase [Arthrobacter citreus]|nr:prolyl oligopeptidase family serine peptidase [Arthrobacter citreus]